MIVTMLEVPVVFLYLLTGGSNQFFLRIITRMNNSRKKTLNRFGQNEWVWNTYDGKEDKYIFLERQKFLINLLILLVIILLITTMLLSGLLDINLTVK